MYETICSNVTISEMVSGKLMFIIIFYLRFNIFIIVVVLLSKKKKKMENIKLYDRPKNSYKNSTCMN